MDGLWDRGELDILLHTFTHTSMHIRTSLVAQLVKNPPAMQEIPVRFLCWEDPPGEGIDYPLQELAWASLVAQMVKNPPAMQETWVWSLGWEDLLEEGMAAHSSILGWKTPMDRGAW